MTINIAQPQIETNGDRTRLCSRLSWEEKTYDMWFEVDEAYSQYLCHERADAFVAAVLPYAMAHGIDIVVDAPLSEQLYYQLSTTYIPAMARFTRLYRPITLSCGELLDTVLPSAGAVGTGLSGGVDSFHTIVGHLNPAAQSYALTHLTFFNVGASGDKGGERARRLFRERAALVEAYAAKHNFHFLMVDSNVSEFVQISHEKTHTMRSFSAVLAVQKLFKIYYYSASQTLETFNLSKGHKAAGHYDLLSAHCFTNENTTFYITGQVDRRIDKVAAIADYPPTYVYLNVCVKEGANCSHCEKCMRTMLALYALDKLELYQQVFDVESFMKHLPTRLAHLYKYPKASYYKEIRSALRASGKKIPLRSIVWGKVLCVCYVTRKKLSHIPVLRRNYDKLKARFAGKAG